MGNVLGLVITALPLLRDYFTKNKSLNTVTGGFLGAFAVILMQNAESVDQMISALQNQGQYGLIAGAVIAGLRTAVFVLNASKAPKNEQ